MLYVAPPLSWEDVVNEGLKNWIEEEIKFLELLSVSLLLDLLFTICGGILSMRAIKHANHPRF